jgi:hypothetical protein
LIKEGKEMISEQQRKLNEIKAKQAVEEKKMEEARK